MPATPACYLMKRVIMNTHSVAQELSSLNWKNAHMGHLPNRVFMAIVGNDAYTGRITKNPYNFKRFSTSQLAIHLNGEMPAPPLRLNFADNQYIGLYRTLFSTAG